MPTSAHTKIFDESTGYGAVTSLRTLVDCTVVKHRNRWWMYLCGVESSIHEIQLFSASLDDGAPLSASGWVVTPDANDPARPELLAGKSRSFWWDGKGGRHCPAYVKGWDPEKRDWVERIYYGGAAQNFMGPYAIGHVEWDGQRWVDFPAP